MTYRIPPDAMHQSAPWPTILEELVGRWRYRGWRFVLEEIDRGQDSRGLTLDIITSGERDAYHEDRPRPVHHYRIVPPAAYNYVSWLRWLFDQCVAVEFHEAMEHAEIRCYECDGSGLIIDASAPLPIPTCKECEGRGYVKPFPPRHGPGFDPYVMVEYGTDEQRRTLFTGEVKP